MEPLMRGELVAIDLETTGLDPAQDAIIEIGAVRMVEGKVVEEFSTLVNPNRPIPPLVTQLTGIQAEDVADAPPIQTVLPRLRAFAGSLPWMAHNISFDAAFLNRQGLMQNNLKIDTYELASVLLPKAARYNLTALTQMIGFDIEAAHRALYDARASAYLYWMLWQKALDLPYATLREIVEASQDLTWDARPVFEAALREKSPDGTASPRSNELFGAPAAPANALQPSGTTQNLKAGSPTEMLESLASSGYEARSQQITMAEAIASAFNSSEHLLVEAGTGTGKSLAYLIPAIQWATSNGQRVVISTNTINLQEQLLNKDIPALQQALNISFTAALLKGRTNYLCPRRLDTARRRRPATVDEVRMLAKILVWLLDTPSGDRGDISLRGPDENVIWNRLSAEDEGCTPSRCESMGGICPFYKARKAADAAHLLVVNHALLIADALTENRALPDYRYAILDEAHNLEEATTHGLSFRMDEITLRRRLTDLGSLKRGLLSSIVASVRAAAPEKDAARLESFIHSLVDASRMMDVHVGKLFEAFRQLILDSNTSRAEHVAQVRITNTVRNRFTNIQSAWQPLNEFLETISSAMHQIAGAIKRLEKYNLPDAEELLSSTETASRYLGDVQRELNNLINTPDANMIYWINAGQELEYLSLHSAPLNVAPLIEKHLWSAKDSVILTSATLQTTGGFEFVRERLGASEVETLDVGSPFNYHDSTLLYLPNDLPDPNDRHNYQQAVERGLIELAAALDGRVMALFTSYSHLRQTAQAIAPRLALGNITVYDQSDGSSRQALLDGFKSAEKAVLLGARSFWEGVDIPGSSLSALVIVRLPFAVPTDPIFAARSETFNDTFNDYTLPEAILRFRQGFGRLIRSASDRGVVTVFDSRLLGKSYGAQFIEALPDCTQQSGPLSNLAQAALNWINRTT
jgi:ATP-dependent DNA helicase DinG